MDITDQDVLAVVWDAKNNIHAVVKELGIWEESMVNDDYDDDDWQTQECSISDTEEAIMDNAVSENNSTSEQERLRETYDQQEYNNILQEFN